MTNDHAPVVEKWERQRIRHVHRHKPVININQIDASTTAPVKSYEKDKTGEGLFDMIGNVWEWTDDWYTEHERLSADDACCAPEVRVNPSGGEAEASIDPRRSDLRVPRKVMKGGSHLCAPNYCLRYRPAARQGEAVDTSTSHIGFRCVRHELPG